jgi:hypothetical protein
MAARINSGAIRPQSAAVTEYVNVMEKYLWTWFYLINALLRFCSVFTTDGSIKKVSGAG